MSKSPNIHILDEHRQATAELLNKLLADEFVLYTKTRRAHWNVEGPQFIALHKLFETQFEQLDEIIDSVAERIRTLGHFAVASLTEYLKLASLLENDGPFGTEVEIISSLVSDHETIIKIVRPLITRVADEFKDIGTSDFLTGVLKEHEKTAWFLRAHLG